MAEKTIKFSLDNLKRIAASQLTQLHTFGDLVQYYKMKWCQRYNVPFKSELLKTYNHYELLLEMITCEFMDDPKSLDDFIRLDNGEKSAIAEDDERWFREQMEDGYTEEEYHSEDYKRQMETIKNRLGKDVTELPDGEHNF